jgi:hypothetical protein
MNILNEFFSLLASYFDFVIDFLSFKDMGEFARTGEVSSELLAFLTVGSMLCAAIMTASNRELRRRFRIADYNKEENRAALDLMEHFWFGEVLSRTIAVLLFHAVLLGTSKALGGPVIGSVKDTVNAICAFYAVSLPLRAIMTRFEAATHAFFAGLDPKDFKWPRYAGGFVLFLGIALLVLLSIYGVWFFLEIHELRAVDLAPSAFVFLMIVVLPFWLLSRALQSELGGAT